MKNNFFILFSASFQLFLNTRSKFYINHVQILIDGCAITKRYLAQVNSIGRGSCVEAADNPHEQCRIF